jgi:hypothetical protein
MHSQLNKKKLRFLARFNVTRFIENVGASRSQEVQFEIKICLNFQSLRENSRNYSAYEH